MKYDVELMYLKGKDNIIADAVSCVSPLKSEEAHKDDFDIMPVHHITSEVSATEPQLDRMRVAIQADPVLSQPKHQIFQGWPDVGRCVPERFNTFLNYRDELAVEDGLIFKGHKLVILASQKHGFLQDLHAGHLGEEMTLLRVRESVYWPGIGGDNNKIYQGCNICQAKKRSLSSHMLY